MKISTIIIIFISISSLAFGQKSAVYSEKQATFKMGKDFFEKGVYAKARTVFDGILSEQPDIIPVQDREIYLQSELLRAKSAIRLKDPNGENLILDFVRNYSPDPLASTAVLEVGNFYFNNKEYDKASKFYSMIDIYSLSQDQKSEIIFKKAYSFFVKKKFGQAKSLLKNIIDIENKYYYPSNYYYGLTLFFSGKYDNAIPIFKRVSKSKKYRGHIPYYLAQIYFAEQQYDELIDYAIPVLKKGGIKKVKEINQLIGQAYFEKKEYKKALPFLEFYAERSGKMKKEEFYQLGYTEYINKRYKKSVYYLKELAKVKSKLGQNAIYTLGDAYIKIGKKSSARSAFGTAAKMKYDKEIQTESKWNYAKLSYELGFANDAISALQSFKYGSQYYNKAQSIMSDIFLNTRDYKRVIKILDGMPELTPKLRETYQKVTYLQGLQYLKDGNIDKAKSYFQKSLELPKDAKTKILAYYWLGDIAHKEKDYVESISYLNKFLPAARSMSNLPDESSLMTGNYSMGYNLFKQKKYDQALNYFEAAVNGIHQNKSKITNNYVKNHVLGDAVLRTGDCYFKKNDYAKALRYYDDAVKHKHADYVYALFQKAIISGLQGNNIEKIESLETIVNKYPTSEFADNSLFELGSTYQSMNKNKLALANFGNLVKKHPNSNLVNPSILKIALISYNKGDTKQAIKFYKAVFKRNPTKNEAAFALDALEEIYITDLGQTSEFIKFKNSIGYNVGTGEEELLTFNTAESKFENGQYSKAIIAYSNYLSQYPAGQYSLRALYQIGESNAVSKNYDEALRYYEKVIDRKESRYYTKAIKKAALISYNHSQDFEKSYKYFSLMEMVATTEDDKFDAQLWTLRSAYRINKVNAVYEMADKVANNKLASKDQIAFANFYLGKVAFDKHKYDDALVAFNKVVRNIDNEQAAEARYSIAKIYFDQGELGTAKQLCIASNTQNANYPYWVAKSVILLSDILVKEGDYFNAKATLEALIENFMDDLDLVKIAKEKLKKINKLMSSSSLISPETDDDTLEMDESEN